MLQFGQIFSLFTGAKRRDVKGRQKRKALGLRLEELEQRDLLSASSLPLSVIKGAVYTDTNGNGQRDASEGTGLSGWTVYLDANNNGQLDTGENSVLTDATGAYSFVRLSAGTYNVREILPADWIQTAGKSPDTVTVKNRGTSAGNDFGNFQTGRIGGEVYVYDSTASPAVGPGLSGWTVQLLDGSGTVLQQATTNAGGGYSFAGLTAGTFSVREVVPDGWTQTAGQKAYTVTVTSGTNSPYNQFGNLPLAPSGSILGAVYVDSNGNGQRDAGEGTGLSGWTVYLDANNNGQLDTGESSVLTDATGAYSFTKLSAGTYNVREVLPAGWAQTAGKSPYTVTLASGTNSAGNDFGNFQTGRIAGEVYVYDSTASPAVGSGLSGWTVYLDANNNGQLDTGERSAVTDATGAYSFTGLTAGTYNVREIVADGWVQTAGNSVYSVTVISGTNSSSNNFGNRSIPPSGSILGAVYLDSNANGQRDAGEIGLSGWTVYLDANNNGQLDSGERSAVTDATGAYSFTGLTAGTYKVREVLAAGWKQTGASSVITVTVPASYAPVTAYIGNVGASNTIVVDGSWLQNQGTGPSLLTQANTTYVLATDVDVPGTAFVDLAANVVLDLNGHTVTYGDSTPLQVANGGFEQGSSPTDVPGWDLTGAPGAFRKAARTGMWGDWMLEMPNFTTPLTLFSSPIQIPTAGHEYAATITPRGTSGVTLTLKVIDTVTGSVLASANSANVNRGFGAVATFTPTTTDPVKLEVDITPPTGASATVDLDYAGLFASHDFGVVATKSSWYLPSQLQTSAIIAGCQNVANFTLQNGQVLAGQARSYGGNALDFISLGGVTVTRVTTLVNGMDSVNADATYASNVTLRDSTFRADVDNISNRMRDFAAIQLRSNSGTLVVQGNTILNSPEQGINLFNNKAGSTATISNNIIKQNAIVTEGYGIAVNGATNFVIANNTITPTNGRGILLDSFNGDISQNGQIYGNYVTASEGPNLEYGANAMEATAFRMRGYSGGQKNVNVYGNTFIATTGAGKDWTAIGVRITETNTSGLLTGANDIFHDNLIKAVVTTTDPGYHAWALSLSGVGPSTGLQISYNRLESNDVSLQFGDNDSYGGTEQDILLVGNTLVRSTDGAARPYTAVLVGAFKNAVHNVQLIDTQYPSGVPAVPTFTGTEPKDVETGWLLNVLAVTSAGSPIANATVQVTDGSGATIFTGTTDAQGRITGIPVITTVYSQSGSNPLTTTSTGPFKVTVTSGLTSVSQTFDLTSDPSLTLTL